MLAINISLCEHKIRSDASIANMNAKDLMYGFRFWSIDHSRNTVTYHNALCLSPQNFAEALSSVWPGSQNGPKGNWKQCLCKLLGRQTKSIMVCYGIFWSVQLFIMSSAPAFVKRSLKMQMFGGLTCHVWTHFERIFTLSVHVWIQTMVSQPAGLRGRRRKRQLPCAKGCWLFIYWFSEDHKREFSSRLNRFHRGTSQPRTVFSGQIFPRTNLLTRGRK